MYMTLKPIEAVREEELPHVAAPWYARSWLKSARSGYCQMGGFHNLWEASIQEQDPHRQHWNHRNIGFERLCDKINQGDWVVVLDKSWPPLAPAYYPLNEHWLLTHHVWEPEARQRLESQVQTIQRAQREEKALQSQNRPPTPEPITEPAGGPGSRAATLGPHEGLHNQDWNAVKVKPDSFKTVRKVEMETLSVEDKAAKDALLDQG